MTNIITQIWTGAEKVWDTVEADITADIAKVEAVLPGAAPVIADIKQAASDALGIAAGDVVTYEPQLATGLEAVLDAAMTKYSGGLALPLVPGVNAGVQGIGTKAAAIIQAWLLKQQAALAENNATTAAPANPTTAG